MPTNQETINGLLQQRQILCVRLGQLTGGNKDIATRSDIREQIERIDVLILQLSDQ